MENIRQLWGFNRGDLNISASAVPNNKDTFKTKRNGRGGGGYRLAHGLYNTLPQATSPQPVYKCGVHVTDYPESNNTTPDSQV